MGNFIPFYLYPNNTLLHQKHELHQQHVLRSPPLHLLPRDEECLPQVPPGHIAGERSPSRNLYATGHDRNLDNKRKEGGEERKKQRLIWRTNKREEDQIDKSTMEIKQD